MARRIVRFADLDWSAQALLDAALPGCGARMAAVIGLGMTQDRDQAAPVANSHGFSVEWLEIPAGGGVSRHRLEHKQVLVVYRGSVEITVESGAQARIAASGSADGWDAYAMPGDCWRAYRNRGATEALVLVMTPGDARKTITWTPDVVQAAGAIDRAIDANGYVAGKRFVDRSQR